MRKRAFTLIELLIVIAIIAILATIIILNVLNARKKANDSKMLSTASSIQKTWGVCLAGGSGILNPDTGAALDVSDGSPNVPENGNICMDATVAPGTWISFSTPIKGTNGDWGPGVMTKLSTTTYLFDYRAAGGTDYTIECSETGCAKIGW